jgi:peptidoglycan/LPS O-acetylase OafA/YrhL
MSGTEAGPGARAPKLGYRPALDGVRGIAVLLVVFMHTFNWPPGGFLGVDLFFVLSGFLITTLLVQEWQKRTTVSLPAFYRRRAFRLVPGLVAVVATYIIVRVVLNTSDTGASHHHLSRDVIGALAGIVYVSNIVQAAGDVLPAGIRHLWSLGAEEQFYLLWPPILLLTLIRAHDPIRRLKQALLVLLVVVVSWRLGLTLAGASQHRLYFGPDTSCDTLIVGCIVALWFTTGSFPSPLCTATARRLLPPIGALTLGALVLVTRSWNDRSLFAGTITLFALASATIIAAAVLEPDSRFARSLCFAPLVFTGRISYSLYLWHPVILTQSHLAPIPAFVASFAAATASYYGIERPFLRRKNAKRQKRGTAEPLPIPARA